MKWWWWNHFLNLAYIANRLGHHSITSICLSNVSYILQHNMSCFHFHTNSDKDSSPVDRPRSRGPNLWWYPSLRHLNDEKWRYHSILQRGHLSSTGHCTTVWNSSGSLLHWCRRVYIGHPQDVGNGPWKLTTWNPVLQQHQCIHQPACKIYRPIIGAVTSKRANWNKTRQN